VSDQPLELTDKPVKAAGKDWTVFLFCIGCRKEFLANPDEHLKKLNKKRRVRLSMRV
jgi:hypothetical protein